MPDTSPYLQERFTLLPGADLRVIIRETTPMDSLRDYSRCVLRCPRGIQVPQQKDATDNREGDLPYSIIQSPSFIFLVGPKHTKLTIQSGLAYHVSKPLHNLMNNGHTRESKHRIAVLEDEDVETFVAFCEYAYTGDYNVPSPPAIPEDHQRGVVGSAPGAGNPWRETLRSNSTSSAVPPKAPSAPLERAEMINQVEWDPEAKLASTIEEDVSAEAEAEAEAEEETKEEEEAADAKDDAPSDATADNEGTDLVNQVTDATVPKETSGQPDLTPAVEAQEWAHCQTQSIGIRRSKRKDKKKKRQKPGWSEESVANLTPPSTPPPSHPVDADECTQDNAPEETTDPEPAIEPEAAERQPTQEPVAEPIAPEHAQDDDGQPSTFAASEEDVQHQDPCEEDDAAGQNATDEEIERPKPVIDMSFAKQSDSSPRTPGLSLWDEFVTLQYPDDRQAAQPTFDSSSECEIPYLTFHAKVYVFATRYLIPALAQLCLRKLHRDLLQLSFADIDPIDSCPAEIEHLGGMAARRAPMVLDLLRYAYTKTTRLEPISPTSATQLRENELRRLVVHYAACKVKELARYNSPGGSETATPGVWPVDAKVERADDAGPKSLRTLLDLTPELASDLVYRMM